MCRRGTEARHQECVIGAVGHSAAALLLVFASACSSGSEVASRAEGQGSSAIASSRLRVPIVSPEWERDITPVSGSAVRPVALRAGGGLAASLHGPPLHDWKFVLAERGHAAAGGPHDPLEVSDRAPIRDPTDIVGVSSEGLVWYLDRQSGRIIGEDIGGHRRVIASLGIRGTVRTACALGERSIAFLDDARPGRVFVRDLEPARRTREVPVPAGLVGGRDVPWNSLRFGGSPNGPCVLSAPRMRGLLVVSDSAVTTIATFVEPLVAADEPRGSDTWFARLLRLMTRPAPPPVGALDATSFPGGVAVLFAGRTVHAGRLIDLYSKNGEYLETMQLSHRALRIAGTRHRLIVLSARADSVYLASYVLPPRVRSQPTADEPLVVAPPDPDRFHAAPADTSTW